MKAVYTWAFILAIIVFGSAGDVLQAYSMKRVGDLGELRKRHGFFAMLARIFQTPTFFIGIGAMALGFFSLLLALSWADVSLVAPASASLTFMANAFAARVFLKEKVDVRRWIAAACVAAGVALMAI